MHAKLFLPLLRECVETPFMASRLFFTRHNKSVYKRLFSAFETSQISPIETQATVDGFLWYILPFHRVRFALYIVKWSVYIHNREAFNVARSIGKGNAKASKAGRVSKTDSRFFYAEV